MAARLGPPAAMHRFRPSPYVSGLGVESLQVAILVMASGCAMLPLQITLIEGANLA